MNSTVLLRKLIAIERMVGKTDNNTLRELIYEAEDYLIQMQSTQAKSFLAEAWRDGIVPSQLRSRAPNTPAS